MIFSVEGLTSFYKTEFVMSDKFGPSDIASMPYLDFKVMIMLYNSWLEEKRNGSTHSR